MDAKLTLPVALAVVVLAGCGDAPPESDAGPRDSGTIADAAGADAGCEPFEEWDPTLMECIPLA